MKNVIAKSAVGVSLSRAFRQLSLVLLLLPLIAAPSGPARADDNSDAANTAVQIFVAAGQAAGLPITQQEAALVTQVVACGVAGQNSVGDCAKNAAVTVVLQQAGVNDPTITSAVTCLVSNPSNPTSCAAQAVVAVAKLPPDAQPAVNCMLTGGNVADCGKKLAEGLVLDKVPPEIQAPAKCVIEGGNATKCATDFVTQQVVSHLPPNMQAQATQVVGCLGQANVAGCITSAVASGVAGPQVGSLVACATAANANVGKCAADFASANMPKIPGASDSTNAAAQAVVACVGAPDFAACAKNPAITGAANVATQTLSPGAQAAINAAMATIQKLQPDAPLTISATKDNDATLQNIVKVADGIKNHDWAEVTMAAGPELAIAASNIILSIFLSPAVADALGPAVAAMIHNDAAAAQLALEAMSRGDLVGFMQVAFTWYETHFIDEPCALMGDNDVRNTVCGALSDAIKDISDAGGDVAKKLLGMGKDVLQWLGVWNTVNSVATFAWNTLTGLVGDLEHLLGIGGSDHPWRQPADCASFSPKDYFANNYLTCVAADAANIHANGGLTAIGDGMNALSAACQAAVGRCIAPDKQYLAAATCAQMGAQLAMAGIQVSSAMSRAADAYNTIGLSAWMTAQFKNSTDKAFGSGSRDFCSPTFWSGSTQQDYVNGSSCSAFVDQQFPGVDGKTPQACPMSIAGNGAAAACLTSIQVSNPAMGTGTGNIAASLVGPDGSFCKAQQAWQAAHHCKIVSLPFHLSSPTGKLMTTRTVYVEILQCDPDWLAEVRRPTKFIPILFTPKPDIVTRPPWWAGIPVPSKETSILFGGGARSKPPFSSSGATEVMPSGQPIPPGAFLPRPGDCFDPRGCGGSNAIIDNATRVKPPILSVLPRGGLGGGQGGSGGSSGISEVDGCTNDPPAPGCAPSTKGGVAGGQGGSGGSSGVSTVNGCSGNSPAAGCKGSSQSSSGFDMVRGDSGNTPSKSQSSSGFDMVKGDSGNSPTTTKLKPLKDAARTAVLPKGGGGSSGISTVNGCSGNSPAAGCPGTSKTKLTPFKDTTRTTPSIAARPSVGVVNTPRAPNLNSSGTNAAIDRLSGGGISRSPVLGGGGANAARKTFVPTPPPRSDPNDLHVR